MDKSTCNIIHDFNTKYQGEVGSDGHNISRLLEKARKKNDLIKIKEYETDLRIATNLDDIDKKCINQNQYNKNQCENLMEGITSWEYEFNYWTNKWYIKPFVSKNKRKEGENYIQSLKDMHTKICNT